MSLSFREEAAIRVHAVHVLRNPNAANASLSTISAQALADECCEDWGHDWKVRQLDYDEKAAAFREMGVCARCGLESKEKPE